MKQYLTPEQTAKLIELGFEKPPKKGFLFQSDIGNCRTDLMLAEENYSIGELIEMLPNKIYVDGNTYSKVIDETVVCYYSWELEIYAVSICDVHEELIDNLYEMVVKLQEEEMI